MLAATSLDKTICFNRGRVLHLEGRISDMCHTVPLSSLKLLCGLYIAEELSAREAYECREQGRDPAHWIDLNIQLNMAIARKVEEVGIVLLDEQVITRSKRAYRQGWCE